MPCALEHQQEEHQDQEHQDHEPKDLDPARTTHQDQDFQCARKPTTISVSNTPSGLQVIAHKDGLERTVRRCAESVDIRRSEQGQHWFGGERRIRITRKLIKRMILGM